MKIVIYALGKTFECYKDKIIWEHVVAVSDKKRTAGEIVCGKPVIRPDALYGMDYDYLAIFSTELFERIRKELVGEYFVPYQKIISWREVIEGTMTVGTEFYKSFFKMRNFKKILDMGTTMLQPSCLTKDELFLEKDALLDVIQPQGDIQNVNLYDHAYQTYDACTVMYDAVLIEDILSYDHEELEHIMEHAACLLFYTRFLLEGKSAIEVIEDKMQSFGRCTYISTVYGIFWTIEAERNARQDDISIFVVMHKDYNVRSDRLYKPLCVGGFQKENYLSEQFGENITYLNKKINECTALFWIWKNTSSQYVGLNHYRRYFYNNEIKSMDNYLCAEHIGQIMKSYDIILPQTFPMADQTVFGRIYYSMDHELCEKGHALIRRKIKKYQPDYLAAFDRVMSGRNAFMCNMFVTRREILDQYCEWLFSFLIEAAEEMDVEGYDSYSQRVMGFFAERMWTVWLSKNKLRIKELPYATI